MTNSPLPLLRIAEIFYSLQGEGIRAGRPSIFIRTSGCKTKGACYALGIRCDTEFESGKQWSVEGLLHYIKQWPCNEIVWTGGEPTDQLTTEHTQFFKHAGYYQCIETSGLNPPPGFIDFTSLSPKVAEHVFMKNFPHGVDEIRFVRHKGQDIPVTAIKAKHYMVSPHSDGFSINRENLNHCIQLCLDNPMWRLSVQQHKFWNVL